MGQESPTPFEQPEGLDFTPPKADFLDKTTPAHDESFEEFQKRTKQKREDIEEIARYGTPEGKVDFRKMVDNYPTEIPESFTPQEGRPMTHAEMDQEDLRAKRPEDLN